MDLVNELHGVQVVDTRVEANLVHDHDTGLLDLVLEFANARADVARSDNVGLTLDGSLDDRDVVDVRDERNDKVVLCNSLLQNCAVCHIERYSGGVGQIAS